MIVVLMGFQLGLALEQPEVAFRVNKAFVDEAAHLTLSVDVLSEDGVEIGYPRATGMSFEVLNEIQTRTSDHVEQTLWFTASAKSGSYIIQPPLIKWGDQERSLGHELFVDIGHLGPRSDLAAPVERKTAFPVLGKTIAIVLAFLFIGLTVLWKQRVQKMPSTKRTLKEKDLFQDKLALSEKIFRFRSHLEKKGLGAFTVLTLREANELLFTDKWEYPSIKILIQEVLELGERLTYSGDFIDENVRLAACSKMETVVKYLEEQ